MSSAPRREIQVAVESASDHRGLECGLAPTLSDQADLPLAFGALTWPHQLVRIMLLEQIYRATTILAGYPYHRE
jgi:rRNA large subunit m3Psi methyltransferase RlmH